MKGRQNGSRVCTPAVDVVGGHQGYDANAEFSGADARDLEMRIARVRTRGQLEGNALPIGSRLGKGDGLSSVRPRPPDQRHLHSGTGITAQHHVSDVVFPFDHANTSLAKSAGFRSLYDNARALPANIRVVSIHGHRGVSPYGTPPAIRDTATTLYAFR